MNVGSYSLELAWALDDDGCVPVSVSALVDLGMCSRCDWRLVNRNVAWMAGELGLRCRSIMTNIYCIAVDRICKQHIEMIIGVSRAAVVGTEISDSGV